MSKPALLDTASVNNVCSRPGTSPFHDFFDRIGPLALLRHYSASFFSYDCIIVLGKCSSKTHAFTKNLLEHCDSPGVNEYWKNKLTSIILNPRLLFQARKLNQTLFLLSRGEDPQYFCNLDGLHEAFHFHASLLSRSKDLWRRVSAPTALFKQLLPQVQTQDCQNYLRDLFSLRRNFDDFNDYLTDVRLAELSQLLERMGLSDHSLPDVTQPPVEAAPIEPILILQLLQIRQKRIQTNVVVLPKASSINFSIMPTLVKVCSFVKAKFAKKTPLPSRDPKIQEDIVSLLKSTNAINQLRKDKICLEKLICAGKGNRPANPADLARYQQMEERHQMLLELITFDLPQVQDLILDEILSLKRQFAQLEASRIKKALSVPIQPAVETITDPSLSLDTQ